VGVEEPGPYMRMGVEITALASGWAASLHVASFFLSFANLLIVDEI
jgi:hypothetical protein